MAGAARKRWILQRLRVTKQFFVFCVLLLLDTFNIFF
jgi:hypothetical protein